MRDSALARELLNLWECSPKFDIYLNFSFEYLANCLEEGGCYVFGETIDSYYILVLASVSVATSF